MELLIAFLLSPTPQMALAGGAGGAIRWAALRRTISTGEGLLGIPVGAILAIYLNPLTGPIVEFAMGKIITTTAGQEVFSGFLCGAWGLQLATLVIVDLFRIGRPKLGGGGGKNKP